MDEVATVKLEPATITGGCSIDHLLGGSVEDFVVIFMTQLMPSATFNFRGQLKNIVYSAIED